jgi:hypoxanthine phosphoribosyltransferase
MEVPFVGTTLSWLDIEAALEALVADARIFAPTSIVCLNRGGAIVGGMIAKGIDITSIFSVFVILDGDDPVLPKLPKGQLQGTFQRIILVDDIVRSGEHMRTVQAAFLRAHPGITIRKVCALHFRDIRKEPGNISSIQ